MEAPFDSCMRLDDLHGHSYSADLRNYDLETNALKTVLQVNIWLSYSKTMSRLVSSLFSKLVTVYVFC